MNVVRDTRSERGLKMLPGGGGGLTARAVGKTYKGRPVVRNVTVTLHRGEAVGLLGPNGAGKTTTFYMIVGLVKPDTGAISLDGADITRLPMYRRARLGIGYPAGRKRTSKPPACWARCLRGRSASTPARLRP